MTTFKKGITYPPILAGLILLFLALIMSFAASYRTLEKSEWHGVLGPGNHTIEEGNLYSYDVVNRTLVMWSDNASVLLSLGGEDLEYVLNNGNVSVDVQSAPQITVLDGDLEYEYVVYWFDYPYSYLTYPAFFLMIIGGVFAFRGYISFLETLKEDMKKQKGDAKNESP
ncbi:hypothetical membrane protein, conserved [Thermococcus kodakarensis KOD1]|uniref:Hypothetical membrane protein, conserved n=1 Tax=Thermococcus kodakarensis (strain ATCC BAA-918 / JCM 12380 / KOD1) TaxID=69014 RepID=Q5JJ97_THEKO|nr:hypothetical membrane protein, conserved [Thermococcus kodakarensis KOD1]